MVDVRPLFIVREECATVGGRDSDVMIKSLNKKTSLINEWIFLDVYVVWIRVEFVVHDRSCCFGEVSISEFGWVRGITSASDLIHPLAT